MRENRKWFKIGALLAACCIMASLLPLQSVNAASNSIDTEISYRIKANDDYKNWEGVSNVSQFKDEKGNYWRLVCGIFRRVRHIPRDAGRALEKMRNKPWQGMDVHEAVVEFSESLARCGKSNLSGKETRGQRLHSAVSLPMKSD